MDEKLSFESGRGAMSINPRGGGPGYMWQRDLVHCLPMIMQNAVLLTQAYAVELGPELREERMLVLDTLAQFYLRLYAEGRREQAASIRNMADLVSYMEALKPELQSVCAVYHIMFANCLFAHMFATKELMIATPESLNADAYDYEIFLTLYSQLSIPMNQTLVKITKMEGLLNNRISLAGLNRPAAELMRQIRETQNERLAKGSSETPG